MNTIFKRSFFAVISLLAMLFLGSSCEDTIGVQVTAEAPNADKSLKEIIINDAELTDFVEVLNACDIAYKNSDEIISVVDSLFGTSRVYTVWAPVNGSFDKASLLERIRDGYRDDVMKTFVASHVANFVKYAKGAFPEEGELILMLNNKKSLFTGSYKDGYTFGESKVVSVNERAKNGILHKLESRNEYHYNIWEYIREYALTSEQYKVDSLVNYLYSRNDTNFVEHLSIPGPTVDGVKTYLDSVFTFDNELLNRYGGVGGLDNEDSLFTFYLPTNDVWDEVLKQVEKHFNYSLNKQKTDTALIDSLKYYKTRFNIIKYLTFSDSESDKKNVSSPDSMMPTQSEFPRKLFARSVIEDCVVESETKELSNGTVKIIDRFPYTMFDLWHDTIRIEAEDQTLINTESSDVDITLLKRYSLSEKEINKEAGNKISGSQYISYGDATNSRTTLVYRIPGVKSATYKVALVTVPRNISNSKVDLSEYKPPMFECAIKAWNPNKKSIENLYSEKTLLPKVDCIDTLFLSDPVTFVDCEYLLASKPEDYNTQIQIKGNSSKNGKNDNTIRLDAILLIPVEDAE